MAKKYNTPTSGNVVDHEDEREFLDALSACVMLTPEEEERFCPTRNPSADDMLNNVPNRDDDDEDDFGPDLDDLEPSDEDLVTSLLNS